MPTPSHDAGPGAIDRSPAPQDAFSQMIRAAAILRRRWLVLLTTTVLCVAAAAVAASTMQPRWRTNASIVLHMSEPHILDKVKSVSEDGEDRASGYREYYQTQRTIMRSRTVAARALETLGLAEDPVFLGIDGITSEPERLAQKAEVDPIERLRTLVSINEVRNSRVVEITAEFPDATVAADIANAVADAYLKHVRDSRDKIGLDARSNLVTERDKAHQTLRMAEKKLADFKQQHEITSVSLEDRQNVITQNILTLSARTKDAEARRIELAAAYTQAKRLHGDGNLASASLLSGQERSIFERMRQEHVEAEREYERINVEFGPKAPEHQKARSRLDLVDAKIERESADLLASLDAQRRAAREAQKQLNSALGREQKNALALSLLEREYRELEREASTTADAYTMVAKRETEIGMTNRVEAGSVQILDRATVPRKPVFPRVTLLVVLGLIGGVGLGSVLALSVDLRDNRIRGLLDLERALSGLGLPVLGQLPALPADARIGVGNIRAQRRQRDLYAMLFPQSLMAERCRGIRTSVAFAQGDTPLRTLMITSPSSSEGKSSTAMNLALSFAQSNKRVVIMDADMRRPRIHQVFPSSLDHEDVGLSHVLSDQIPVEDAMAVTEDGPDNMWVLPCGTLPENPAELLESPKCRRVLEQLKEFADVIIIDTPPVLPVTDPLLLAHLVDGVCVVARCGTTTRGELQRALTQLRQGDTNILGVVLNEVDARQERYSYNYGYYTYGARNTEAEGA